MHKLLYDLFEEKYSIPVSLFPRDNDVPDEPPRKITLHDNIVLDECLGTYEPKTREIKIYTKGIEQAAGILACTPDDLRYIVLIHEWSHAFIHLGMEKDVIMKTADTDAWDQVFGEYTQKYFSIESTVHELLAQLLTYHVLRMEEEKESDLEYKVEPSLEMRAKSRLKVFDDLAKKQPPAYQIHTYKESPKSRVIKSIELLRNGGLAGKVGAWGEVIRW